MINQHIRLSVVSWLIAAILALAMIPGAASRAAAFTDAALPTGDALPQGSTPPEAISSTLELVGQFGGSLTTFAVSGDFLYAGIGPRLKIIALDDPAHLRLVGESDVLPALLTDLVVSGRYLYVALRGDAIRVFDVVDPAAPVEVGWLLPSESTYRALAVEGNTLYVIHDAGLSLLDISNPLAPTPVSTMPLPMSDGGRKLAVVDQMVYVAASGSGVRIVDARNPAAPVEVGFLKTASPARDLAVAAPYVYAVTDHALVIIDVTDFTAPVLVSSYALGNPALFKTFSLAIAHDYAYVTTTQAFFVFNVANPVAPVRVGSNQVFEDPFDLVADGRYVYVAGSSSLQRFLPPQPSPPPHVGLYAPATAMDAIDIETPYAYIADKAGLQIVDVSHPLTPVQVGYYPLAEAIKTITVAASLAYVVDRQRGALHILDVSSPAVPRELSRYDLGTPFLDLKVFDTWVFVLDKTKLHVLDVTNPHQPQEVASLGISTSNRQLDATQAYAYITTDDGVRIVDIRTPALPVLAGFYAGAGWSYDLLVASPYAYIASGYGLYILDLTTPTAPRAVSILDLVADRLAVVGHRLYAVENHRLSLYDIADPAQPVLVFSYQLCDHNLRNLALSGAFVLLTADSGLYLLDLQTPVTQPAEAGKLIFPLSHITGITVDGDFVYTTDDLRLFSIIDITDPARPTEVSHVDKPYPDWSYFNNDDIEVANGYVYTVEGGALRVFNIIDPTQPVAITHPITLSAVTDIAIAGEYAYAVGDFSFMYEVKEMWSIDIHNPEQPRLADSTYINWTGEQFIDCTVALSGHYAYVGSAFSHWRVGYSGALTVVDIVDPEQLAVTGSYGPGAVWSVAANGDSVYTMSSVGKNYVHHTLHAVNVSNPLLPTPVASLEIASRSDIVAAGSRAYLTTYEGVTIFDVHTPSALVPLLHYPVTGGPTRAAVSGDTIYLATNAAGFFIFRYVEASSAPRSWLPIILRP